MSHHQMPAPAPGLSLTGLCAPMTCPRCAADLALVTNGRSDGWTARAVVGCTECGVQLLATMTLTAGPGSGTPRHRRPAGNGDRRLKDDRT